MHCSDFLLKISGAPSLFSSLLAPYSILLCRVFTAFRDDRNFSGSPKFLSHSFHNRAMVSDSGADMTTYPYRCPVYCLPWYETGRPTRHSIHFGAQSLQLRLRPNYSLSFASLPQLLVVLERLVRGWWLPFTSIGF